MIRCVRAPLVLVKRLRVRDVSFLRSCGVQGWRRAEVRFFASWPVETPLALVPAWLVLCTSHQDVAHAVADDAAASRGPNDQTTL